MTAIHEYARAYFPLDFNPLKRRASGPCFIYLPISAPGLAAKQRALVNQLNLPEIKPTDLTKLHITLVFVENCSDSTITQVLRDFRPPAKVGLEVSSVEVLDGGDKPALVWLVNPDPGLVRLQSDLYYALVDHVSGMSEYSDPKVWKAHITIAYDLPTVPAYVPEMEPFKLTADRFVVGRDEFRDIATMKLDGGVSLSKGFVEKLYSTELDESSLYSILRGERAVVGPLRRALDLKDGPFRVDKLKVVKRRSIDKLDVVKRGGEGSGNYGHAGRPGEVGGSAPGEGYSPRGEARWLVDSGGKILAESNVGETERLEANVTIDYGKFIGEGVTDIHTHPDNSWPSDGDWSMLAMGHADEVRVILDDKNVISLTKPENFRYSPRQLRELWTDKENEIFESGRSQQISVEKIIQEINEKLANETGVKIAVRPLSDYRGQPWADSLIVERGGPGSGHFDHAGRPGEIGGSAPNEAVAGGPEVYHGTTLARAKKILANGIKLSNSQDGRVWAASYRDLARDYAMFASDRKPYGIVVIDQTKLPERLAPDEFDIHYGEQGKWSWDTDIPPEAIIRVEIWANKDQGESEPRDVIFPNRSKHESFVPILLDGDDAIGVSMADMIERGGPESGNYGHAGRPGEVGGSAPSNGDGRAEGGAKIYAAGFNALDANKTYAAAREVLTRIENDTPIRNAWVSPTGEAYHAEDGHNTAAYSVIQRLVREGDKSVFVKYHPSEIEDPEELFMMLGWMRVAGNLPGGLGLQWHEDLTESQKEVTARIVLHAERAGREIDWGSRSGEGNIEALKNEVLGFKSLTMRGGPGSGNFGHAGRLGEVGGSLPEGAGPNSNSLESIGDKYPVAGQMVDGREIRGPISDTNSISASLMEWEALPDIREIKFSDFSSYEAGQKPSFYSREERERTEELASEIKDGGWIEPLIVAVDDEGPWVLEGVHRFDALMMLGAKSFPALVVIDREKLPEGGILTERGGPGSGHFTHDGRPGSIGGSTPGEGGPASWNEAAERAAVMGATRGQITELKPGTTREQGQRFHDRRNAVSAADKFRYRDGSTSREVIDSKLMEGPATIRRERFYYEVTNRESGQSMRFTRSEERDYIDTLMNHGRFARNYELVERGGPGSGHHGHAGREGEVGGSEPGEGTGISSEARKISEALSLTNGEPVLPEETPELLDRGNRFWLDPDGDLFWISGVHADAAIDAIEFAGLGSFSHDYKGQTDASKWMLDRGFTRVTSMWPKQIGIETKRISDKAIHTIREMRVVNPDWEVVVDSRFGEPAARRIEASIERHLGPGPHPSGTEQEVHAGGGEGEKKTGTKDGKQIYHGTGAKAARSIMKSGLQVIRADSDNVKAGVIFAAGDYETARSFATRRSANYAIITIDTSLAGSKPSKGPIGGELMFGRDIPSTAIVKVDIYRRGERRADDKLVETIERTFTKPMVFVAASIDDNDEFFLMGPTIEDLEKRHLGPGPHPSGSEQEIHAGGGGGGKKEAKGKETTGRVEGGTGGTRTPEALSHASRLFSASQEAETRLTPMMETIAGTIGGKLEGLENAVKSEESLARKIDADAIERGLSREQAANAVTDANRYTMTLEADEYVNGVLATQKELEVQGYTQYDTKWRNYFGSGDAYDGYNSVYINQETGERFEVQFHTPETLAIKHEVHEVYEQFRAAPAESPERLTLWERMQESWQGYTKPSNWQSLPGTIIGISRSILALAGSR